MHYTLSLNVVVKAKQVVMDSVWVGRRVQNLHIHLECCTVEIVRVFLAQTQAFNTFMLFFVSLVASFSNNWHNSVNLSSTIDSQILLSWSRHCFWATYVLTVPIFNAISNSHNMDTRVLAHLLHEGASVHVITGLLQFCSGVVSFAVDILNKGYCQY